MSGSLLVENDGGISVDEGASLQLADHPGRFALARTAPHLLLAIPQPDGGSQQPIGRVAFSGDLDGVPFSDVVMLLAQGRRSGLFHVITGAVERTLVFAAGDLVAASSTQAGERLGEVALRLGLLERADLARLLSSAAAGRRVGQRLVERGLLDRERLEQAVQAQIALVFEAILLRPVGSFFFRDHPVPPQNGETAVAAQGLLLDGLRRLDELAHYRTRIPSPQAPVRRTGAAVEPPDEAALQIVAGLETGEATAAELADRLRLPEVEVMRTLFHLAEAGAVEVREDRAARPLADLGADPVPLRDLLRSFNRIFCEVFTEVALAGVLSSFVVEAQTVLASGSDPLFAGLAFDLDGSLPLGEILQRLPEAAQASGKGPRTVLLESLQPVLSQLIRQAEKHLDPHGSADLHARLRLLFGTSEW